MGCGLLLGLGGLAGGTALSEAGAKKSQDSMNSKVNDELKRQVGFQQQNLGTFKNSLANSSPLAFDKQLQQGQQQSLGANSALQLPGMPQAKGVVGLGTDVANRASAGANAGLRGYNNAGFQQGLNNMQTDSKLGLVNSLAQMSEQPLGAEIQQASHSGDLMSGIGSLLSSAGGLAGLSSVLGKKPNTSLAGLPSSNQMGAMGAGFGPASSSFANSLPASTVQQGNFMFSPQMQAAQNPFNDLYLGSMFGFNH